MMNVLLRQLEVWLFEAEIVIVLVQQIYWPAERAAIGLISD